MNAKPAFFCGVVVTLLPMMILGCASTPRYPLPENADLLEPKPLTQKIALIADTQFHESRGTASSFFGKSGDELVPVTVRSAQQVIGAGDLLLRALSDTKLLPLVLHVGDAIDVSCETEWNLFSSIMEKKRGTPGPRTWLLAFGNHDGYLAGNLFPKRDGIYKTGYWENMCNGGRLYINKKVKNPYLPKEVLVGKYLETLTGETPKVEGHGCSEDEALCWTYRVSKDKEQWTSFVAQVVKLPAASGAKHPVYAILLDTSDTLRRPYALSNWVGEAGGISVRQLNAVWDLVKNLPKDARYFFVGHHPVSNWNAGWWDRSMQEAWSRLNNDPRSLRFAVTAHTHEGGWNTYIDHVGRLTELNIGSLSDSPVYYRTLEFEADKLGRIAVQSNRVELGTAPELNCNCPDCDLPTNGSGYSVKEQQSKSDRVSARPLRCVG